MEKNTVKIGTRGSQLALFQAELTKTKLLEKFPDITVDIVIIKTKGDKIVKMNVEAFQAGRAFSLSKS